MGNRSDSGRGRLDQIDGRWQLTFTRRLAHPREKVWRALTETEYLAGWFPARIEGERAVGAALRFVFPNDEGPTKDGEMIQYDPPAVMEYRWDNDTFRYELMSTSDGCVLTFVNILDELGKAARVGAGWHICLDQLEHELAGQETPWEPRERWEEVHNGYLERLPAAASTIGPPE